MRNWLFLFLVASALIACDPEGKKDCAWVLEPEPNNIEKAESGFIPVCARNRDKMKQDCRLQAPLDFAKSAYGKKFRYVDLKIKDPGLPRTIVSIEYCE